MSTSFEVYPSLSRVPTLVEVLKVANEKLNTFLQSFEVQDMPLISVRLGEKIISPSDLTTENMMWDTDYAWFYIEKSNGGGSDAYCHKVDEFSLDIWDEYGEDGDTYAEVRESLYVGHYWSFRRSSGQPAIINLAYGLIASAVAELTEGYLFSDDGAWPGKPIRSTDFDAQYFNPSPAQSYADAVWYESCLVQIISLYKGKIFEPKYQLFESNELTWKQRLVFFPSNRLLNEGPDENDRLFIMFSMYDKLPYLYIDRTLISASEESLDRLLKLIDIKHSPSFFRHSFDRILEVYKEIDFDHRDILFWVNPLFIEDGEGIRQKIT